MLSDPQTKTSSAVTIDTTNLLGVRILGTGKCTPNNAVHNDDLAQLGYDSDWIIQRTGIESRFHVEPGQATSDLAIAAAKECLEKTGVTPDQIDLILLATMTADHYTPSTACLVQAALGCKCGAIDLNAACSGFMYALIIASQFVKNGSCKHVLVIGAETMSMVVDPLDKKTYPLFGDGAAAAIVTFDPESASEESESPAGILAYRLASVGEMGGTLVVPGCGSRIPASQQVIDERQQFLKMEGRAVFKWAVRLIPDVASEMLRDAGLTMDDVDLIIPHQANRRIIDAAAESLNVPTEKIFMNLERYGNTSAASVPICLHEALESGRIKPGNVVLLIGFGAGLTWGSCLIRW